MPDQDIFATYDSVVWDNESNKSDHITDLIKRYGNGPFKVARVFELGDKFTKITGHPQNVAILINDKEKCFSGYWLKKV